VSGLHRGTRQHLWQGGACLRCQMRTHWAGAKDGCSGVLLEEEARNRQRRYEERRRASINALREHQWTPPKSDARLAVEAAGMRWELYRSRRKRGYSHEEAMAMGDRRHTSMPEHGAEERKGASS